ncbi:hypothetical protein COO91_08462 [Nostoc flagelliforme CCNUN1]|uniref:Uncharacterized protein n=1 Tax=Nostoc flagelliforme CCNUN1 TaxID=2038116 RepID=A0A2K8T3V4_9NOSO|nr:hypothetical protein COO91_08462 [Nostoc flagelliforme CCNUN1]
MPAIKTRGEVTLSVVFPKVFFTLVARLTLGRSAFGLLLELVCLKLAMFAIFPFLLLMYLDLRAGLVAPRPAFN